MLKIAQIKPNSCSFENMTYDEMETDSLQKKINDLVNFVQISAESSDNILKNIIDILNVKNDTAIVSHKCFETNTNSFFMLYTSSEKTDEPNSNMLARFLSENHEPVAGNCVIINTKISPSENCDMNMSELLQIIKSKFIHHAVTITTDDQIVESIFYDNPLENTQLNPDCCRCVQTDIFGATICVFLEHYPIKKSINKFATLLCKKMQIQGDVVVSILLHKKNSSTVDIFDINQDLCKKILCVRSHATTSDNTDISEEVLNGHFYNVIDKYAKKYNDTICETIPDDVINGQTMNSSL